MIWFVIVLIVLAAASLSWSIHDNLKEAERIIEEEKFQTTKTTEEINSRIEGCPWRDRESCSRYGSGKIPCDGACSWVVDYAKFKK